VHAWLAKAGICKAADQRWGAHISKAPGKLVGEYAIGDTVRTRRLYDYLLPKLTTGELASYDRERELMPILLRNESEGMRIDVDALAQDVELYTAAGQRADEWLRKALKAPNMNIDSDVELANALESNGIVTVWDKTPTGRRSTAKKTMTHDRFSDPDVFRVLGYRNRLGTCLSTFMEPWLTMATQNKGYIYTRWNQVRQSDAGGGGTRTGRLSCSPNFQNIPKDWYDKGDGYAHPKVLKKLPPLPMIRKYVLPDKGQLFLHRDYNQQELRILAHFEDDKLCAAYRDNPRLDMHTFVQQEIRSISGLELERRPVKILNFGLMYGMGLAKLAVATGLSYEMAGQIKRAQRAAIPGIAALEQAIRQRAAAGEPIVTWGGRRYYCEEPKEINGRLQTFEYKLLNYLIQGSAAECTKQAVINYDKIRKNGRFMVTVHDEINLSCPPRAAKAEMKLLAEAMESVKFDVPMLSDGKMGQSWGSLEKE
jgi:DNA polymerase-1